MTRRRRLLALALAAAGCGAPDPCDGTPDACLALHVDPAPMVRAVDLLDIDVAWGARTGHSMTRAPDGRPLTLPAATALALAGIDAPSTPVAVALSARLGARVVGTARVDAVLGPREHATRRVALTPVSGDCLVGGLYCGGDKLAGDAQSLYRCTSGAPTLVMACADGCAVHPDRDDACR